MCLIDLTRTEVEQKEVIRSEINPGLRELKNGNLIE
jgi:hypothetical protein